MSEIQRFDVGPRMSEMAVYNGVAYLAGQVAEDGSQGIEVQTAQVLAAIDKLLAGTESKLGQKAAAPPPGSSKKHPHGTGPKPAGHSHHHSSRKK